MYFNIDGKMRDALTLPKFSRNTESNGELVRSNVDGKVVLKKSERIAIRRGARAWGGLIWLRNKLGTCSLNH